MGHLTVALGWGAVGIGMGALARWASVRLARAEELDPGERRWQVYGPVAMMALLFALFAWRIGAAPLLLVRSLWVVVLVQVIFFDLEHQLILDRVLLPSAVLAVALSVVTPGVGLVPALLTGLVTGLAFLTLAAIGSVVFRAEAMGLGDVKFSAFMGLILGPQPTFDAIVLALIIAGLTAIGLVLLRLRSMTDSIPYGPFLAIGALAALYSIS